MDESTINPDPAAEGGDESGAQPEGQPPPRTPRWVLVLGIVALVLILAAVAQLVFGIRHGPGLHGM